MISAPDNLLCLGRSGTGKTTCSALRLFSTNAVYKYMEELREFKKINPTAKMSDFKIDPQFMNKENKLKLVFVTASPVLTNEVRKFYFDVKDHFTEQLVKRRQRALAKKEEKKEGYIEQTDQHLEEHKDYDDYLKFE